MKTTRRGALCYIPVTKCYLGDEIKKNEMDGACGTYGGGGSCIQGFGGKT